VELRRICLEFKLSKKFEVFFLQFVKVQLFWLLFFEKIIGFGRIAGKGEVAAE
jgi:hypothetical protein